MTTKNKTRILHAIIVVSALAAILIETSDPAWMAMVFRFVFIAIMMFAITLENMISDGHYGF